MDILVNPVVAILYNEQLKRWHPIVYREAPLPGPHSADKPVRHKSTGHHTSGFETRELALAEADGIAKKIVEHKMWPSCAMATDTDMPWDGDDIPADVAFFTIEGTVAKRLL